jgi:acyl-CoA synthetase (AMP-forming)/AMP-acid ligase II
VTSPGWSQLVRAHADARPGDRAFVTAEEEWTLGELVERSGGAAQLLGSLGLPPGTPVPGLVEHVGTAIALVLAGSATGRPYAPLGARMTAAELAAVVQRLDAPVLLTESAHGDLAGEVAALAGDVRVVVVDALGRAEPPPVPASDGVAGILHTSGTTGLPKAVPLTEQRLAARCRSLDGVTTFGPGDTYLAAAAFHHIAGIGNVVFALGLGGAVAAFPRFSVEAWKALAPRTITHTLIVPSMVEMLLDAGALDAHEHLRLLIYGASPIAADTLSAALDALPHTRFLQLFGQTEGTPLTALLPEDHDRARSSRPELLNSAGRAAPHVELRLHEPDGDGVGEVWARGPHLNLPDADGWVHTGDLGRIDDEGYVYLVGRAGDTINRGGENVRPIEVEEVLRRHPSVADVAVAGVPDKRLGERVAAFVVLAEGASLDTDALRAHARATLAGFKVPEVWHALDELPRNAGGKVLRRVLIGSVGAAQ